MKNAAKTPSTLNVGDKIQGKTITRFSYAGAGSFRVVWRIVFTDGSDVLAHDDQEFAVE